MSPIESACAEAFVAKSEFGSLMEINHKGLSKNEETDNRIVMLISTSNGKNVYATGSILSHSIENGVKFALVQSHMKYGKRQYVRKIKKRDMHPLADNVFNEFMKHPVLFTATIPVSSDHNLPESLHGQLHTNK
jgi:hypothetical protein